MQLVYQENSSIEPSVFTCSLKVYKIFRKGFGQSLADVQKVLEIQSFGYMQKPAVHSNDRIYSIDRISCLWVQGLSHDALRSSVVFCFRLEIELFSQI